MGAAKQNVRCAEHSHKALRTGCFCHLEGDWKFADAHAERLVDGKFFNSVVIMAGNGDAVRLGTVGEGFQPVEGDNLFRFLTVYQRCKGFITEILPFVWLVLAIDFQIFILPLSRGMVHEGKQVHIIRFHHLHHIIIAGQVVDLIAQMVAMTDQPSAMLIAVDQRRQSFHLWRLTNFLDVPGAIAIHRDRMKHGGDAAFGDDTLCFTQAHLKIHDGGAAWLNEIFDHVRMNVDHPGHDHTAIQLHDVSCVLFGLFVGTDGRNMLPVNHQASLFAHLIGQYQGAIS